MPARNDHQCSDPHWQSVLAMVGKPFEELTIGGQIAVLDAVNRRRSLHEHETDLLCDLVEKLRQRSRDLRKRNRQKTRAA